MLKTLKSQLVIALFSLLAVMATATYITQHHISQQENDTVILNLANKLQITAQQLVTQARNYQANAPRDYDTYYRDVELYYRDLMAHMDLFDKISGAFMSGGFPPELTNMDTTIYPLTNDATKDAVNMLEAEWLRYKKGLLEKLGDDHSEPRLEWGADYIVANQQVLENATNEMLEEVQNLIRWHHQTISSANRTMLVASAVVVLLVLVWLFLLVLRPLGRTVEGFQRAAQGDFDYQVSGGGGAEMRSMATSFNALTARLRVIFNLIERLQQGSDLHQMTEFIWEELGDTVPMDWTAILLLSDDGASLHLHASHCDNGNSSGNQEFAVGHGNVSATFTGNRPVTVAELGGTECNDDPLLEFLASLDMRSALMLPLSEPGLAVRGLLVFAHCEPDAYKREHAELLRNLGHLVTHSFSNTVNLVESARFATLGKFASGIAHEIRNPLTTIGMAIDYFRQQPLDDNVKRRAELAEREVHRVTELLNDILLYAKPMALHTTATDLGAFVKQFTDDHAALAESKQQQFVVTLEADTVSASVDPDRLIQVLLNLTRNACEAAPEGASIEFKVAMDSGNQPRITIHNGGRAIPPEHLNKLTTAFFTTRAEGTGLGLAIVQRIVSIHGGELAITSTERDGTAVSFTLPAG